MRLRSTLVYLLVVTGGAVGCGAEPTASLLQADGAASDVNPDFARKLREGDAYRVNRELAAVESICGTNDMQEINSYNGQLGQPVEFARLHKYAVAAMASGNTPTSSKYCSGTLIGPDLYLTAGHCVDSGSTSDYIALNYEKVAGGATLLGQDFYKIKEIVEDGDARSLDYAVLRVEGNPGLKWGWATVRNNQPPSNELITIIQHPSGDPKKLEVGHVSGFSGSYMRYGDLDTEPGSSGSGIVDSRGHVFGVHTNGGCTSSGGANSGTRLNAVTAPTILTSLAQVALPFQDGTVVNVNLRVADGALSLAADLAGGGVTLAPAAEADARIDWTVIDGRDGSFQLKATDAATGKSALLYGAPGSARVQLAEAAPAGDYGTRWRIVKTPEGGFLLRTVGGAAEGPRWLSGQAATSTVALGDASLRWEVVVR